MTNLLEEPKNLSGDPVLEVYPGGVLIQVETKDHNTYLISINEMLGTYLSVLRVLDNGTTIPIYTWYLPLSFPLGEPILPFLVRASNIVKDKKVDYKSRKAEWYLSSTEASLPYILSQFLNPDYVLSGFPPILLSKIREIKQKIKQGNGSTKEDNLPSAYMNFPSTTKPLMPPEVRELLEDLIRYYSLKILKKIERTYI